jgi:hypothetical protein
MGGAMHTRKTMGSHEDECNFSECGNCVGIPFAERIVTCIAILLLVFIARSLVNLVYLQCHRNALEMRESGDVNREFLFPAWEGA